MVTIPLDKLAYIIEKAREYDAEVPLDDESASNPTDDGEMEILRDSAGNPSAQELKQAIDELDVDERAELLALTWLGRGDYHRLEWRDALREARDAENLDETGYLMGTPLLADYLAEGAATLGYSLPDYVNDRH